MVQYDNFKNNLILNKALIYIFGFRIISSIFLVDDMKLKNFTDKTPCPPPKVAIPI